MTGQNRHREFAYAYVQADMEFRQASQLGKEDKRDEAFSRVQDLEKGVVIIVQNPEVLR